MFDSETQFFWVAPSPKDKSGVVYDELSDTDKKKNRRIQIQGNRQLVELERCLPRKVTTLPRQHLRTSCQQTCWTSGSSRIDGSVAAKSRSVLVGWIDPMIYQLERAAPTPTQEGIMVTLQWLASAKVTGHIADLTNAFGQARKTSRKTNLPRDCHQE